MIQQNKLVFMISIFLNLQNKTFFLNLTIFYFGMYPKKVITLRSKIKQKNRATT